MLLVLVIPLCFASAKVFADEQTRRIQEELRRRSIYFVEIDGKFTEEISRALKAYQKRKGFPVTGEADADTLAALNIAKAPATDPRWPEMPVLKSDVARRIREEERKLVEELNPIAEPPDPADAILAEEADLKPGTVSVAAPAEKGSAETGKAMSREQAEQFVQEYLDACESNDLAREMAFYADEVRYFDHGPVNTAFIEQDVSAFYKRWPKRSYHLYNLEVVKSLPAETFVKFRIGFQYRGVGHRVAGKTENVFAIQHAGGRPKFIAMREQRLRD
jgi:hypothetical protein